MQVWDNEANRKNNAAALVKDFVKRAENTVSEQFPEIGRNEKSVVVGQLAGAMAMVYAQDLTRQAISELTAEIRANKAK
jgi:cell division protein FtsL